MKKKKVGRPTKNNISKSKQTVINVGSIFGEGLSFSAYKHINKMSSKQFAALIQRSAHYHFGKNEGERWKVKTEWALKRGTLNNTYNRVKMIKDLGKDNTDLRHQFSRKDTTFWKRTEAFTKAGTVRKRFKKHKSREYLVRSTTQDLNQERAYIRALLKNELWKSIDMDGNFKDIDDYILRQLGIYNQYSPDKDLINEFFEYYDWTGFGVISGKLSAKGREMLSFVAQRQTNNSWSEREKLRYLSEFKTQGRKYKD